VQPPIPAAQFGPLAPRSPPDPRPALDDRVASQHEPQLSVAAVARKLGIAPATLRTWDRRYGIGPADHTPGRYRRYSADDLARLELMRYALLHGASPASAANYALTTPLPRPGAAPPTPIPNTAAPDTAAPDAAARAPARAVAARKTPIGTDHVASARAPGWQARGLARAATALDPEAVRGLLNESITAVGAQITWDVVVRPVLDAIAQRWVETGTGIEVEHLLSDCVTGVFSALAASTPTPTITHPATARPVLLAGMAGDQHRLPLVVLSATLAQRGVACRSLGTDLPADALIAAIRRTAPVAILLWSALPETADPDLLKSLPRTRPGFRTFVAGPGWADVALGPQIVRLRSLQEATEVISTLVSA
jgi:MerR family transcriptional regulator, light-induced transcriptional regulator